MKILVWGTGSLAEKFFKEHKDAINKVLAFIDSDEAKQKTIFFQKQVIDPSSIQKYEFDFLLILSSSFQEIIASLKGMIPEEKIIKFCENPYESLKQLHLDIYLEIEKHSLAKDKLITENVRLKVEKKVSEESWVKANDADKILSDKLLEIFKKIKSKQQELDVDYKAGSNWDGVFKKMRLDFYEAVEQNDNKKLADLLANFCRNCMSSSIMGGYREYKNFHNAPFPLWLSHNLKIWNHSTEQKFSIKDASMPATGNLYGYMIEGSMINWNSFPNHYRAYYCLKLLQNIERPVIAEIGGGFGGFAYFLQKLSDSVTYINFDLPENLIVSSYYLTKNFPDKKILYYSGDIKSLNSDIISKYDIILMPNFMIKNLADLSVDLFINTISFSEMDISTVAEYLRQIERTCRYYLYHENLTCSPKYKGFPVSVFPDLKNFYCIMNASNRWMGFDAYNTGHSYFETIFLRSGVTAP